MKKNFSFNYGAFVEIPRVNATYADNLNSENAIYNTICAFDTNQQFNARAEQIINLTIDSFPTVILLVSRGFLLLILYQCQLNNYLSSTVVPT